MLLEKKVYTITDRPVAQKIRNLTSLLHMIVRIGYYITQLIERHVVYFFIMGQTRPLLFIFVLFI